MTIRAFIWLTIGAPVLMVLAGVACAQNQTNEPRVDASLASPQEGARAGEAKPGATGEEGVIPDIAIAFDTPIVASGQPVVLHIEFPADAAASAITSAKFRGVVWVTASGRRMPVHIPFVSWTPGPDQKTGDLVLGPIPGAKIPSLGWVPVEVVVSASDADTKVFASGRQKGQLSLRFFPAIIAFALTALTYVLGACSIPVVSSRLSFSPIRLARDGSGRASLANMQIIFFTVIMLFLVSYILLRTGVVTNFSNNLLLLLGIAAIGSIGSKLATNNTRRLSFENWVWAMRKGWTASGLNVDRPSWSDLFTTDDKFDPYKFQMLSFSLVVGSALLIIGVSGLANFAIPPALLGVIGLSQATYVGGKVVTSGAFRELDEKLSDLRKAESDFVSATATAWTPPTARDTQLKTAVTAEPGKYLAFKRIVQPAWVMFRVFFVAHAAAPDLEPRP